MNKLILIGNGGHSKVIQDIVNICSEYTLYAILDEKYKDEYVHRNIVHSNFSFLDKIEADEYLYCIAIGNSRTRKQIFTKLTIPIENYVTLIHPSAVISESVNVDYGTVIMPNVVINANTSIGNHCIINTGSIVEHDNVILDYVHVSPNATLTGDVTVGKGTQIGASATIIPGKKIGDWCTVGAGSVVLDDIPDNRTVVGIPAKEI